MNFDEIKARLQSYRSRKIYLGFSGGADSTALLLLLSRAAAELGRGLEAVHFDHHLRSESGDDARWCEQFCRDRQIPCRVISLAVAAEDGDGVEAAARRCRLTAWRQLVEPEAVIALGHHAGDRAENLLLRLCRGSNVSALTSMRAEQVIDGMTFIRPLLSYTREEIVAYLHSEGIVDWREDSSNHDTAYRRNFFRREILPAIYREQPGAEAGLARSLEVLEQDAAFIEMAAAGVLAGMDTTTGLDLIQFNRLHPALRIRLLRYWLRQETGGEDLIPERHVMERLAEAGSGPAGETQVVPLRGGMVLQIRHHRVTVARETAPAAPQEWNWRKNPVLRFGMYRLNAEMFPVAEGLAATGINAAGFDPGILPETLIVRTWQEGDRMIPFGRHTAVKVKKIFTDAGLSPEDKRTRPLVVAPDGTVIWIVGLRRANFAPVPPLGAQAAILYVTGN